MTGDGSVTYDEAIQFLYDLQFFGAKLELENPRKLSKLAGNPQDELRFIHVAGTNGKGSTCAMLDSVYRRAGLKVGLFTSPHLVSFRERIRINGERIPEAELVCEVTRMQALLKKFPGPNHPTFFEVVVVLALNWFKRNDCDLVIWETGLGGRLDATNIVTPLASVITNVSLDHQKWLGETVEEIAREKAGIIKPGVPTFTAADDPAALEVIRQTAANVGSEFVVVSAKDTQGSRLAGLKLSLRGAHQRLNAALAAAAVERLKDVIPVKADLLAAGLEEACLPGRFEVIEMDGGGSIVLDGAHNVAGVDSLLASLSEAFPERKPTFILGILDDKAWPAMCAKLAASAASVTLTPVASVRSANAEALAETCRKANPAIEISVVESPAVALERCADRSLVVATGSMHYLGEVMEALGIGVATELNERSLNEYQAS